LPASSRRASCNRSALTPNFPASEPQDSQRIVAKERDSRSAPTLPSGL
jgi:hypothetical protein